MADSNLGGLLNQASTNIGETVQQTDANPGPRYSQLIRKDARLREEQVDALERLARRLSRNRQNRAQRITENTLIRVAVDLLLNRADHLAGDTEQELLGALFEVLSLEIPDSCVVGQPAADTPIG